MVKIIKKSILSGKSGSMEFNVEPEVFYEALRKYEAGAMVQDAFPMLTAPEREFLISGITPEEWKATFGEEEEPSLCAECLVPEHDQCPLRDGCSCCKDTKANMN